jgi:hypothetical protein
MMNGVPVRDHQPIFLGLHLFQRSGSVGRVIDVLEAELLQEIADDPHDRVVIIDNQDRSRQIDGHRAFPRIQRRSRIVYSWRSRPWARPLAVWQPIKFDLNIG